jgi:hypothetical protein
MVLRPIFPPIKVFASADRMPFPKPEARDEKAASGQHCRVERMGARAAAVNAGEIAIVALINAATNGAYGA